jgi:hypothetical protein
MILEVAKWKYNAVSPVVFMIDDIANISIKKSKSKELQIGEDWGRYARDKNSMWDFLYINLLKKFPKIKTTFFLVTDKRAPMALGQKYSYTQRADRDKKFIDFLNYLHHHPNVELAYHGTTHGEANIESKDFLQEWERFNTLEETKSEIARGREIFKTTLGSYPTGGKYCGYEEGKFGDDSISQMGFGWWCYHWDGIIWDKNSTDKRYSYDLEFRKGVVDIPSTVDGSTLSLKVIKKLFTRKYLKSLYLYIVEGKTVERHIESLYKEREVISIQEHSSPYRTDDIIQYPNIVSDIDNLNYIFSFLAKKDVWYATCSELADYYIDRVNSKIVYIKDNEFKILSNREKVELTLIIPFEGIDLFLYDKDDNFVLKFVHKGGDLVITHDFRVNEVYKILLK